MPGLQLQLGDIVAEVHYKDIRNIHLCALPPDGHIRISAPKGMNLDTLRAFVLSRLAWIRQKQRKFRSQARETPREYIPRESHYAWGTRYLLSIQERDAPPGISLTPTRLILQVRPGSTPEQRAALLAAWYRDQLRASAQPLIAHWEPRLGVKAGRLFVRHMKTRWGSCNPDTGAIRLNTELARKPRHCLEYIVVHELIHLLEPTHSPRFQELLQQHLPTWRASRDELNALPIRHEDWEY